MLNFFFLIFSVVFAVFSINVGGVQAIFPTPTPDPTETPIATPTPTPTLSPEPTPTPTLNPEEKKEFLNKEFQDFLNKEGNFTEEKISYFPIYPRERKGTAPIQLGVLSLYYIDIPEDTYISVYGYLFDFFKLDNNDIVLIMGFDGKDGKRFITPIEIASSVKDYFLHSAHPNFSRFDFIEEGLHIDGSPSVAYEAYGSEELAEHLLNFTGKKIVIDVVGRKWPIKNRQDEFDSVWFKYLEDSNKRVPLTLGFINQLATNGVNMSNVASYSRRINRITCVEDIDSFDYTNVVFAQLIRYRRSYY